MFRLLNQALRRARPLLNSKTVVNEAINNSPIAQTASVRSLSTVLCKNAAFQHSTPLLLNQKVLDIANNIQNRTVTKFSITKGTRKSVKAVVKRFYRLNWGIWIRTKAGRNKKLWKKTSQRKRRLRQHVFCNGQQSTLLDKMVGPYWRKPRYYVNDPYEPYQTREEYPNTAVKPRPYIPKEDR